MSQKLTVPHPKKKIDKTTLIVLCLIGVVLLIGCVVLGAAFDYALGADGSIDGSKISPALHYVLSHPAVIFSAITKKDGYVPKMLFVAVCVIGIFALYKYSEEPKRLHRRGTEHGSAKWGDEKEIRALAEKEKKPYQLALRDENGGYPVCRFVRNCIVRGVNMNFERIGCAIRKCFVFISGCAGRIKNAVRIGKSVV